MKITNTTARDIRFPTSKQLGGSDAMNLDPDYSAAYVMLHTDSSLTRHGLTFSIGRGNEMKPESLEEYESPNGLIWSKP
jgi:L-fuconate dehydratase